MLSTTLLQLETNIIKELQCENADTNSTRGDGGEKEYKHYLIQFYMILKTIYYLRLYRTKFIFSHRI